MKGYGLMVFACVCTSMAGCSDLKEWKEDSGVDTAIGDTGIDSMSDIGVDPDSPVDIAPDTALPDLPPDVPYDTAIDDTVVDTTDTADTSSPCSGILLEENFDAGLGGFTTGEFGSGGPTSTWNWGVVTVGPSGCHGGSGSCWSTNLSGNYSSCENSWVMTPNIDLGDCAVAGRSVVVSYWHWYDFEYLSSYCYDGATVEFSGNGGGSWFQIAPEGGWPSSDISAFVGCSVHGHADGLSGFDCSGTEGTWEQVRFVVPPARLTPTMRIRIVLGADETGNFPGYTFDDFTISAG